MKRNDRKKEKSRRDSEESRRLLCAPSLGKERNLPSPLELIVADFDSRPDELRHRILSRPVDVVLELAPHEMLILFSIPLQSVDLEVTIVLDTPIRMRVCTNALALRRHMPPRGRTNSRPRRFPSAIRASRLPPCQHFSCWEAHTAPLENWV